MESDFAPLHPDAPFQFACGPQVPCFNECCRDLNQVLSPYDIYRLTRCLQITSGEFLKRFASEHIGPQTGLPVVSLKAQPGEARRCPFVSTSGCSVYSDRPASCRIYPLARAVACVRSSGRLEEHFALLREPHCQGFAQPQQQTAKQWIADQEVGIYNQYNDMLMEIISRKNRQRPGLLTLRERHLCRLALYDLDGFRAYLQSRAPGADRPPPGVLEEDAELLAFGHRWLSRTVFGEG